MKKPFVYDEKSSSLYSPDGEFIKKIHCPKAVRWNQLLKDSQEDRSRGCNQCNQRIINLDSITTEEALEILESQPNTCVYASSSSANVIFLRDKNNPESPKLADAYWHDSNEMDPSLPIISTARTIEDIQRAQQMGFWPDVRLVSYNVAKIKQKISVYQNQRTGEIETIGDYRASLFEDDDYFKTVIPWTYFYSHYQETPIAAYLIPKDLPNNTRVLVSDPIEDLVGSSWNQGNSYRALNVVAQVVNRKVILDTSSIQRSDFVG